MSSSVGIQILDGSIAYETGQGDLTVTILVVRFLPLSSTYMLGELVFLFSAIKYVTSPTFGGNWVGNFYYPHLWKSGSTFRLEIDRC